MPKRETHGTMGHHAPRTHFGLTRFLLLRFEPVHQGKNGKLVKLFSIGQARLHLNLYYQSSNHFTLLVLTRSLLPPLLLLHRPWTLVTSIYPPFESECLMHLALQLAELHLQFYLSAGRTESVLYPNCLPFASRPLLLTCP
ncbi:unnamed protein product [Laminaria digitata]